MHLEDSSSDPEDQFEIDVSAFHIEPIPGTGIKLLRAKPETEESLLRELGIPLRLELLRHGAGHQTDTHFLQDVAEVGQTSLGETVYLILSIVVDPSRWQGGWGLALVPVKEAERFGTYLADVREAIVTSLRTEQEQP
jgi:hypothetical protein